MRKSTRTFLFPLLLAWSIFAIGQKVWAQTPCPDPCQVPDASGTCVPKCPDPCAPCRKTVKGYQCVPIVCLRSDGTVDPCQVCVNGVCVAKCPDPCAPCKITATGSAQCVPIVCLRPDGTIDPCQVCKNGQCVPKCTDPCRPCVNGKCVPKCQDPCFPCVNGQCVAKCTDPCFPCDPSTGKCVPKVCLTASGAVDPCQVCVNGKCVPKCPDVCAPNRRASRPSSSRTSVTPGSLDALCQRSVFSHPSAKAVGRRNST